MISRSLYIVAGFVSLALGFLGVFLPILPTTPFVLLAAFCFSRGSERMHRWMLQSPLFGPIIRDWQDGGVIRPRAKWLASFFIFLSFGWLTLFSAAPGIGKILLDVFALGVLGFIWSRPSVKVVRKQE